MPSIAFGAPEIASPAPPHCAAAVLDEPPDSDSDPDDDDVLELVLELLVAPQPATASTPTTQSATMRPRGLVIALMLCVPFLVSVGQAERVEVGCSPVAS